MDIEKLKKSRNFKIDKKYDGDYYVSYSHSNINMARAALELFKKIGLEVRADDVNGGRGVGGYYASGFASQDQAKKLKLI